MKQNLLQSFFKLLISRNVDSVLNLLLSFTRDTILCTFLNFQNHHLLTLNSDRSTRSFVSEARNFKFVSWTIVLLFTSFLKLLQYIFCNKCTFLLPFTRFVASFILPLYGFNFPKVFLNIGKRLKRIFVAFSKLQSLSLII